VTPDQTQLSKIRDLMLDGEWRTVLEIEAQLGGIARGTSISAQLRNLRKPQFGSWETIGRYRSHKLWEYKLVASDHPEAVSIREAREKHQRDTKAGKKDYASWMRALKELLVAVSAVNIEDAEGDPLDELPVIEFADDQQNPVRVSRAAMKELLRLGWWLRAKVETT
jgi:hypothetical protein